MEDEAVDVVIAMNSPVFRVTPLKFASECIRVLRPGGKLFLAKWRDTNQPLHSRIESKLERSKQEAIDILSSTPGTVCTPLDISELEWALMTEKSLGKVFSL
jgi:SAM-dependent methyltransferase